LAGAARRGNDVVVTDTAARKSLPLILARELAANLATPMFLVDERGILAFYNDAAALLIGKPFADIGEIMVSDFGDALDLTLPDGTPCRNRNTPAGIAFWEHRPAHKALNAKAYNGRRLRVQATAYPLFGTAGEMHGVVSVFWERSEEEQAD
jgi:PAS domain-containing protein